MSANSGSEVTDSDTTAHIPTPRPLGCHGWSGGDAICACGHQVDAHVFEHEEVAIAGWWGRPENYTIQYVYCYVDDCDFADD